MELYVNSIDYSTSITLSQVVSFYNGDNLIIRYLNRVDTMALRLNLINEYHSNWLAISSISRLVIDGF
jgi:hypothetical protein